MISLARTSRSLAAFYLYVGALLTGLTFAALIHSSLQSVDKIFIGLLFGSLIFALDVVVMYVGAVAAAYLTTQDQNGPSIGTPAAAVGEDAGHAVGLRVASFLRSDVVVKGGGGPYVGIVLFKALISAVVAGLAVMYGV